MRGRLFFNPKNKRIPPHKRQDRHMERVEKKDILEEKTRVRKVRRLRRSTHWKVYMLSRRQVIGKYEKESLVWGGKKGQFWGLLNFG